MSNEIMIPNLPLLNSATRRTLIETVFLLIKNDHVQSRNILRYMNHELLPYLSDEENSNFCSIREIHRTHTITGTYAYELSTQFDRQRSIRAASGYVGLRNLSNTCYLNSLFTQLYMNVPFREFMLNAQTNGLTDQKLLRETQILFGKMQNSFEKFVDPAAVASSIRTYEESNIDVTIQMDVDEFYNLLFDRWEGQIVSSDAKKTDRKSVV